MLLLNAVNSPDLSWLSGFEAPFRVKANGEYINADMCHAAPVYEDIDGDGVKELLVGQFDKGAIRLYKNYGTDTRPEFKEFTMLQAGDVDLSVPCG